MLSKCLRTDNGLEFCSRDFDAFCLEKGIKRHRIVPLNPQQNGVAERANRTILERVRSMLLASGMEKKFWAETAATAVKLMNMCPSSSIGGDNPDFKWYGEFGSYSHLRIFGCKAYAHLKKSKLDARALRCVMLGYQPGVKGYRLRCIEPGNHKVIVSRDVVFSESEMYFKPATDTQVSKEKLLAYDDSGVEVEKQPEFGGGKDFEITELSSSEDENDTQSGSQTVDDDSQLSDSQADPQEDLRNYQLARDRVRRTNMRPPARYVDSEMLYFALCVAEQVVFSELESYQLAISCIEKDKWLQAMIEEVDSLIKNKTWILVDRIEGKKVASCKWIFKKKIGICRK